MRSLFLFLILLLTVVWISYARFHYVCWIKHNCDDLKPKTERAKSLQLVYQDSVLLDGYDEFFFAHKKVEAELNASNTAFLDTLAQLLKDHPSWRLTIEGLFRRTESNLSAGFHENLGQARANYIRNLLLERTVQDSISLNFNVVDNDSLPRPIKFTLFDGTMIPDEYVKVLFTFHNMTFSDANFAYDDDAFNPGKAMVNYADSVRIYLADHPDEQLTIIGHTDDQGSEAYNQGLGLRRAQSAKDYFEELGITNAIKLETKGESEPMAPNDTEINRQKNRRVNFQID
ncbi:MAG: OmpA family protein [Bacteroidota bacterium]